VSTKIKHAGQSVGLVVADTKDIAFEAVKKVKVSYDNPVKPVLDMKLSIKLAKERGEDNIVQTLKTTQIVEKPAKAMQTIKGEFRIGGQYHMYMETMTCICVPVEDGMDVYSATQCMDNVQLAVAVALGIPNNR
jgi:xanthine dehydrogenase/oxidase